MTAWITAPTRVRTGHRLALRLHRRCLKLCDCRRTTERGDGDWDVGAVLIWGVTTPVRSHQIRRAPPWKMPRQVCRMRRWHSTEKQFSGMVGAGTYAVHLVASTVVARPGQVRGQGRQCQWWLWRRRSPALGMLEEEYRGLPRSAAWPGRARDGRGWRSAGTGPAGWRMAATSAEIRSASRRFAMTGFAG